MKHEKSCGTIIIDQDKVLLVGARDNDGKMFWSFPKGHQEDGETDEETALRETLEEVGLEVEIIDQTPIIVSHLVNNGTTIKGVYLFLAKTKNYEIKPQEDEVESWRWVRFNDVNKYLVDYYKEAWAQAQGILKLEQPN